MTYPATITLYPDRVDKNASGWYISDEYFNIPTSTPYQMYLDHVPKDAATTQVYASGGAEWTEDFTGTPLPGEFYVEYDVGRLTFNSTNAGVALEARYDTLGDDIMAEHVNNMQDEVHAIELELGQGIPGVYQDLSTRLDTFLTAGSSISASQVTMLPPPGLYSTDVQDFIDSSGSASRNENNPFGVGWNDIFNSDGDIERAQNGVYVGDITGLTVSASGNAMAINLDGPDAEQNIFFYDGASPSGQFIRWNDTLARFEISTDLWVNGEVAGGASGVMWRRTGDNAVWPLNDLDNCGVNGTITASGTIYAMAGLETYGNISPDASGTQQVGTASVAFDAGYFDNLEASNSMWAKTYYGDGSNLTGVTSVHNDLANLEWSIAGHTIDANIDPTASGTVGLGTVALAYNDAYIDTVNLKTDPTTDLQAATKQYVDAQVATSDTLQEVTDNGATTTNAIQTAGLTTLGNIVPEASGTRDVGTVSLSFGAGYFDTLEAATSIYAPTFYGDGSNLSGLVVSFLGLTDTPVAYTNMAASGVRVNTTADGLEFYHVTDADIDTLQTVTDRGATSTNLIQTAGLTSAGDVLPDASGTRNVGTTDNRWGSAYIDNAYVNDLWLSGLSLHIGNVTLSDQLGMLYVDKAITTSVGFVGDGSLLTNLNASLINHNELNSTTWSTAGHIIDANINPNASGTLDIGTVALAYNDAHINKVYLEGNPVTGLEATTKDYVDAAVETANEFTELTDTPANYTGASASGVRVNAGETGLEFYDITGTDVDTLQTVTTRGNVTTTSIQVAGITAAGNIDPDASGTRSIGTVAAAFDEAHIDKLYLEADPSTPLEAATKSYVDSEGENYLTLNPTVDDSQLLTGFLNRTDSSMNFNDGTRVFTLSGTFDVFIHGVKHTLLTDTVTIADSTNLHWVYIDDDLDLKTQVGGPGWDKCVVATVFYNTDPSMDKGLIGEERHGIQNPPDIHEYLHRTIGTRYANGLAGSFTDTTFSTAVGTIYDEDIQLDIGVETVCNVFYFDGSSDYKWDGPQAAYYKEVTGTLQYNNGTALANVGVSNYSAMWVFATNDPTTPIVSLMGQRTDTTVASARTNNRFEDLTFGTWPSNEYKILYRVILRNVAGTTTYVETEDLRSQANQPGGTYVATSHSILSNLNWAAAGHSIDTALIPAASGTIDLGSVSVAYDDAYVDKVYLEGNPTMPLQAATKQYVDAAQAAPIPGGLDTEVQYNNAGTMSGATNITYNNGTGDLSIGAGLLPTASGTQDIGTVALAFDDAYINKVHLAGDPVDALEATTKDYVDGLVQGLAWQDAVLGRRGAPVPGSIDGDRYISTATASGWIDNYIYEYQSGWQETIPTTGSAAWVQDENKQYVFNGTDWVQFGSTSNHNTLAGLQGGTSDEYYHLTDSEHTVAIQAASAVQNGYLSSADWSTFNSKDAWGDVVDANVIPDASGTRDVGSIALTFNAGYFDTLEAATSITATTYYGDGSNITGVITDHDTLNNLAWSVAGHTINDNIVPDASGSRDLGTVTLSFDEAYIDVVNLKADPTSPFEAATKQYVDSQLETSNEFTELTDTPSSYTGQAASGVRVNSGVTGLEFFAVQNSFIQLDDTPGIYAGYTASGIRVNGAGTGLEFTDITGAGGGVVSDHDFLNNLAWSVAGHIMDSNITPQASGAISLGTVSLAYTDAHINKLYLEGDPTIGLEAATKDYVDSAVSSSDTFIELNDTPANYTNMAASGVRVNSTTDGLEFYATGGVDVDTLQSVTDRGDTTTNAISIAGLTTSGSIAAAASGTLDIGTVTLAFNDANINKVYLENIVPTDPLQAVTKQYADSLIAGGGDHSTLANLEWSVANHTIDANVTPNASGTIDLGAIDNAYNDAFIDKIYLENIAPTAPLQATTKQYVDAAVQTANEFVELTDTPASYAGFAASGVRVNATTDGLEFYATGGVDVDTLQSVTDRGDVTTSSITTAGLSVTGGLVAPSASGTIDVGSVSLAFDNAYIDIVNLGADPTTALQAATKQYVDNAVLSSDTFVELNDTPANYVGMAASGVRVNPTTDGLEFYATAGGGSASDLQDVTDNGNTTTNSITTAGLTATGDIETGSTNAMYFGDTTTDGSWRMTIDSGNLVVQKRESGVWVTKGTFVA